MYLKNFQYLKNKETKFLLLLISLSVLIRIPVILIYGDTNIDNEWKEIVNNLIYHGEFAYRKFDDFFLPNIYMPPLYPFYLYFFALFHFETQNYILIVLFSQILLATGSAVVFYKINKIFFSTKLSFYSALIFTLFPLNLYACSQMSSVSLQNFLSILFFYLFFTFVNKRNIFSIINLSIISGLLILLRGEFIAILIFSLFFSLVFFKVKIKDIFLILLVVLITISPYLIRNVIIFNQVTITKSLGYNLWKGNNSNSNVEGSKVAISGFTSGEKNNGKSELEIKLNKIPKDKFYQIKADEIFLKEANKNIINDFERYLILFVKKFFSFFFIDVNSSIQNYYHPLHYIPVLIIGITSVIGMFFNKKKSTELNYLIFICFITITIFSIFFILPRYKLVILPLQIIFTNIFVERLVKNFKIFKGSRVKL